MTKALKLPKAIPGIGLACATCGSHEVGRHRDYRPFSSEQVKLRFYLCSKCGASFISQEKVVSEAEIEQLRGLISLGPSLA